MVSAMLRPMAYAGSSVRERHPETYRYGAPHRKTDLTGSGAGL